MDLEAPKGKKYAFRLYIMYIYTIQTLDLLFAWQLMFMSWYSDLCHRV